MILADSSAWIEFLRRTESTTHLQLRELITRGEAPAVTDPVVLEVLVGAREADVAQLRRLLAGGPYVPVEGPTDYEAAAALYRRCRRAGTTPRSVVDCLITAVAIRVDAAVLHADRDFEAIAKHTALRLA